MEQTGAGALAAAYGVHISLLPLQCTFCKKSLSTAEKLQFDRQGLCVRWVHGVAEGCCVACMNVASRVEQALGLQGYISGKNVKGRYGKPLRDLTVRCRLCLIVLTQEQKDVLEEGDASLAIVRGRLRGICEECDSGLA